MSNTSAIAQEQTLHRASFRSDRLFTLSPGLFESAGGEMVGTWEGERHRLRPRKMTNNSTLSLNLEQAVTRYAAWLERQAPGAWEAMKAFRTPQK